jgi:hypothetical protein
MSDETDWKALAAKKQKQANEEAAKLKAKNDGLREQAFHNQTADQDQKRRAEFALQELRKECTKSANQYNSGLTDRTLALRVEGVQSDKFWVTKGDGRVVVLFEIDAGNLDVTYKQTSRAMTGTCTRYGVDSEQRPTVRKGSGIAEPEEIGKIVTPALHWLNDAVWLG